MPDTRVTYPQYTRSTNIFRRQTPLVHKVMMVPLSYMKAPNTLHITRPPQRHVQDAIAKVLTFYVFVYK